jgi:hypothetical protein
VLCCACFGIAALMQLGADIKAQGAEIKAQGAEIKEQGALTRILLLQILERLPPRSRQSSAGSSPPQGPPSAPSSVSNSSSVHEVPA